LEPKAGQFQPKDRDYNKSGGIREEQFEIRNDYVSNSILTHDKKNCIVEPKFRVRKLTSKECWRLMGFMDEDFNRAKNALNKTFYKGKDKSNSQLYKQAGNSIVVNVLMAIFETMR
jgi:DNA (cytosine-5)-methyltransferase 1